MAIETTAKLKTGRQDEWAPGVRFKGVAIRTSITPLNGSEERGTDGPNAINAWGTTDGVAYRIDRRPGGSRDCSINSTYATGDKNPTDGNHGTFDTMYPTAHL